VSSDLRGLVAFVRERETIRLKRHLGELAPWTDDPILAKYRFCNVRRGDDRVSQWLLKKYYPRFDPRGDLWFAAAVARLINWPPTLAWLMERSVTCDMVDAYDAHDFSRELEKYHHENPGKTYTGAYMLYAGGRQARFKGMAKADFIAHHLLAGLTVSRDIIRLAVSSRSVEATVTALQHSFGISSFMAGQVAADLTYLPLQLGQARDLYTWAPRGPGSLRGLNRLHGRPLNNQWDQDHFNDALKKVNWAIGPGLGLTLHDVQNVLCEWDKYERVRLGQGVPRSQYRPETAY